MLHIVHVYLTSAPPTSFNLRMNVNLTRYGSSRDLV